MRFLLPFVLVSVLSAVPGAAAWRVAESAHFRVYGEMPADALRKRVELLEDYRNLLGMFTTAKLDDDAPRLTIYLVDAIASAVPFGEIAPSAAGFYSAGDRGIAAYAEKGDFGQKVLLHEYAHHHMFASTGRSYPAWYVEGFAEYFMTTTFQPKRVEFGLFDRGRAYSLSGVWLPWEQVLGRNLDRMTGDERYKFYAQSWLLTHYLFRMPGMREKLTAQLGAIAKGTDPLTAFKAEVEPDLKALTRQLRAYTAGRNFTYSRLERDAPTPAPVTVRDLPASADDVLMFHAWLDNRGGADNRAAALTRIKAATARHPGDALAQRTLAMAELYLGDAAKALPLLDGLLASAPDDADLLRLKAEALLAMNRDINRGDARRLLVRAVKADPANWRAMHLYLHSHDIINNAVPGSLFDVVQLMWQLAPQASGIVIDMANVLVRTGRMADAARVLEPVAFAPHGGSASNFARLLREAALTDDAAAYLKVLQAGPPIAVEIPQVK
ncbi:hypothetical protein [Sandarakinorhabdus sp.]|jgi:hypothetical protein|uniref:tetratricopeptide repeat protein n=1 Tax=Sandarakinorhabdus sp. TaxID=1916663 RepID=UPI0028AFD02E|nr:hypothetical protein [Sandarakinorhabdus sp.]